MSGKGLINCYGRWADFTGREEMQMLFEMNVILNESEEVKMARWVVRSIVPWNVALWKSIKQSYNQTLKKNHYETQMSTESLESIFKNPKLQVPNNSEYFTVST